MKNSFEVIVMVLAPKRQIDIFINYYKKLGASRVRIFYDGNFPADFDNTNEDVIECDIQFWNKIGQRRPTIVEDRQRVIYNYAYQFCKSAWLVVIDIDEFIFGKTSLGEALRRVDKAVDTLRLSPVEAVYGQRDDITVEYGGRFFRKPYNKYLAAILPHILYPGLGHLFIRGLLGHSRGKQVVRTGIAGLQLNIHDSFCPERHLFELNLSAVAKDHRFYLAHFDAISFEQWREKWKRRFSAQDTNEMGLKRERQLDIWTKAFESHADEQLFRRFYALNNIQLTIARALGLVMTNPLSLSTKM
ncbi:hypothetical protein BH11PSE13_BH11PSE13_20690 [soil metagenome]